MLAKEVTQYNMDKFGKRWNNFRAFQAEMVTDILLQFTIDHRRLRVKMLAEETKI